MRSTRRTYLASVVTISGGVTGCLRLDSNGGTSERVSVYIGSDQITFEPRGTTLVGQLSGEDLQAKNLDEDEEFDPTTGRFKVNGTETTSVVYASLDAVAIVAEDDETFDVYNRGELLESDISSFSRNVENAGLSRSETSSDGTERERDTTTSNSSNERIWADFEAYSQGATPAGWQRDIDAWSADESTAAPGSTTSGRLRFDDHSAVEYQFETERTPSRIHFWFKAERYDDQGLHVNLAGSERGSRFVKIMTGRRGKPENSCYNCPAIATNMAVTTTNEAATVLTTTPTNGSWYYVEVYDIDWTTEQYSIRLRDSDRTLVSEATNLDFFESADSYARFKLQNRMNGTQSVAWVDDIGDGSR